MDDLKVYRQREADLRVEIARLSKDRRAIGDAVVTAKPPRDMTDEERTTFAALGQQIDTTQARYDENAELLRAAEASLEAQRAAGQAGAFVPTAGPTGQLRVQVIEPSGPGLFGRQLQAVMRAAFALKEGRHISDGDQALLAPMRAAPTGLTTEVPSDGGFLVMHQPTQTILQRAYSTGEVLSRVNRMPIGEGFDGATIPAIDETSRADSSRYGGIVSTWVSQGVSVTSGKPKFRQIDLRLRKVMATVYATDEQIRDAVLLQGWIERYLPLELQFRTEDAVINGLGTTQPFGVLTSGAVITVTRATANRIQASDLRSMVNRMWAPLWRRAAFFVDQSTLGEFDQLAIAVGTAGYADPSYKPAGSVPGQVYATYKNIPIIPVEYCAALGTLGDAILVNLDEYVLIDKGGIDQAVSIHVAFLTDEQVFRFIYRVDGQLTWNAALTPKSGGNTLSCAVVLSTV